MIAREEVDFWQEIITIASCASSHFHLVMSIGITVNGFLNSKSMPALNV